MRPLDGAAALLAIPAFLYAGAFLLGSAAHLGIWAIAGGALAAAPLAGILAPRARLPAGLGFGVGGALCVALAVGASPTGGAGGGFEAGFLAGLPFAALAMILAYRTAPSVLLPTVIGGLAGAFALDSAAGAFSPGHAPGDFAAAVAGVLVAQVEGLGHLAYGAPSASLPLQDVADPVLLGLSVLAVAGGFLSFFEDPEERSPYGEPDPHSLLIPVSAGVVAAVGFEAVAARAPDVALLTVAFVVVATFVALGVVTARSARRARRAAGAGAVVPGPGPAASAVSAGSSFRR